MNLILVGCATTYTSSKNANKSSPSTNCAFTSAKELWMAKLNNSGMRGSPCSPPSCCQISCLCPKSSYQLYREGDTYDALTNGCNARNPRTSSSFEIFAAPWTWSNALTPSTDNTVAVGFASVVERTTCPTQSTLARGKCKLERGT